MTPSFFASWRLATWIAVAACAGVSHAHADGIYRCQQAHGKVTFQQTPCAAAAQQVVIQEASPKSAAPQPQSAAAQPSSGAVDAAGDGAYAACRQAGVQVFDPSREQSLQHPQAAFNQCKQAVPPPQGNDMQCLTACVTAWTDEYKKKYLGSAQ